MQLTETKGKAQESLTYHHEALACYEKQQQMAEQMGIEEISDAYKNMERVYLKLEESQKAASCRQQLSSIFAEAQATPRGSNDFRSDCYAAEEIERSRHLGQRSAHGR